MKYEHEHVSKSTCICSTFTRIWPHRLKTIKVYMYMYKYVYGCLFPVLPRSTRSTYTRDYLLYMYMYTFTWLKSVKQLGANGFYNTHTHTHTHTQKATVHVLYRSFFSFIFLLIFENFMDFGTTLKNKNCELHGGYGQWPSEIGNRWNLTKLDSLRKKDLYVMWNWYMYNVHLHAHNVHVHVGAAKLTYMYNSRQ